MGDGCGRFSHIFTQYYGTFLNSNLLFNSVTQSDLQMWLRLMQGQEKTNRKHSELEFFYLPQAQRVPIKDWVFMPGLHSGLAIFKCNLFQCFCLSLSDCANNLLPCFPRVSSRCPLVRGKSVSNSLH